MKEKLFPLVVLLIFMSLGCLEQINPEYFRPSYNFQIININCSEIDNSVTVSIKNTGLYVIPSQEWTATLKDPEIGVIDYKSQDINAIKNGETINVKFFMSNMQECKEYELTLRATEINKTGTASCKTGKCGVNIRII
ncbi:MAG: hypothetical protein OH319_03455 [Candidatus Parvarchaeota archaeon]|nr:hypothetical protein [Candidatus Jingweiarchaeum tengchongense]MCW1298549.1 hypothetical protein [Candidatus Jingweiarchaeum tengchongense]MCW1300205.1 hypothetical protein [Candidatus Jingweiarchaeum tengchongense]MCW1304561.1 hypothetical protein [Candidatus Jingweiarchaeum tengchongense]MCW1305711.1 hypothetical protein [Candidatus Jingweiarchaeum tengchongense]